MIVPTIVKAIVVKKEICVTKAPASGDDLLGASVVTVAE